MQIGEVGATPFRAAVPTRASSESAPVDSLGPSVMEAPLKSFLVDRKSLESETDRLKSQADDRSDPIAARIAQELLEGAHSRLDFEGRTVLMGPDAAAAEHLLNASNSINLSPDPGKLNLEPALALLHPDRADPATLDAVLQLARRLPESPQRELCRQQVQTWVKSGALILEGGTDPLADGLVLGNKLVQTPLPTATQEILAGIPTRDYVYDRPFEPAPGLDRLEQLARDNPRLAGSIVGDMVARDLDGPTHQKLVQLLARAVDNQPLKELLQPHLERLLDYGTRAEEHGAIHRRWGDDNWQAAHYDFLTRAFPETLNDKLAPQLIPMLMAGGQPKQGIAELVEAHRELLGPTIAELARQHPSRPLPERTLGLLTRAAEGGWRPNQHEEAWLVSRVYQPQWRNDSLWSMPGPRAREFGAALDVLRISDAGHSARLPDQDGNRVDLRTYAVNRVLDDPDFVKPEVVAQRLFEGSGEIVSALYLFCPPKEQVERVFAQVQHGIENPRSKYSLENRATTGLGLLAHVARRDPELRDRMVDLVYGKDSIYFTGMGPILNPLLFQGALREMESGELKEGVTPEGMMGWLGHLQKTASWESSEVPALMQRAEGAWEKLQRSHYQGNWPARAPDVGLPGPQAREALTRIRKDFPPPEQAAAWSRLEGILEQLGGQPADHGERLKMAFEMLDTQQAYLSPGTTAISVGKDRVQVGSVNLRPRRR